MRFKPMTEEECALQGLLEAGEYRATVEVCEEATSQAGNEMFKVRLKVYDGKGGSVGVFDYVSGSWMEHKLRHLCCYTGLSQDYEAGQISAGQLVGRDVGVRLGVEIDETGKYDPKNIVKDYVLVDGEPTAGQPVETPASEPVTVEDDLPF